MIPDLPKCVCSRESFVMQLYLQKKYTFFYESLQIAFPNNVLVSQSARHTTEERGRVSRAH